MFENQFDLRYFEMGPQGEASPVTMLTLLEETAAEHCLSIGHSLYDLLEKGIGWVLLSGRMVMGRYPAYKEKITIESLAEPVDSERTFVHTIRDIENNKVCSTARTVWREHK